MATTSFIPSLLSVQRRPRYRNGNSNALPLCNSKHNVTHCSISSSPVVIRYRSQPDENDNDYAYAFRDDEIVKGNTYNNNNHNRSSSEGVYRSEYERTMRVLVELRTRDDWDSILGVCDGVLNGPMFRFRNARLYAELFFALRQRGRRSDARQALTIWNSIIHTRKAHIFLGPRTYRCLVQLLIKYSMIDDAIQVCAEGRAYNFKLNKYVYNTFLNACAKTARLDDAFATLRQMAEVDGVTPDVVSFNCIIAACIKTENLNMALTLLERMRAWNVQPDLYSFNSIVNGLRKAGRLDDAFVFVARMEIEAAHFAKYTSDTPPPPPPPVSESELALLVGSGRDPSLFRTPMYCRSPPDICTYNTLLAGIAGSDPPDLARAMRLKAHMERRGLVPSEVTYNALMATAARGNHLREAFNIYQELSEHNIPPNVECFTTLITLCARAKMLNRAFAIRDHMFELKLKPTVVTYNALISACRHAADGDKALEVLAEMKKNRKTAPDVVTYSATIDALGRSNRLGEALEIFDRMVAEGIQPNQVTYTSVIAAQTRAGDLSGAMASLVEMERLGIGANVFTFSSLINGAGRCGNFAVAFDLLEMMIERNIERTVVTYLTLVENAARAGDRAHFRKAIEHLGKDDIIGDVYLFRDISHVARRNEEVLMKKEGRNLLDELLANIRRAAKSTAWGTLSSRAAGKTRAIRPRRPSQARHANIRPKSVKMQREAMERTRETVRASKK